MKAEKIKQQPFEIAGHVIAPGQQLRFDLPTAQLYTHTPLDMPVEVFHGKRPGPVLLICAAIHGDELNGVEIIRRMSSIRGLDKLHGTLVLVPVVKDSAVPSELAEAPVRTSHPAGSEVPIKLKF